MLLFQFYTILLGLLSKFSAFIGCDLSINIGTTNTLIYERERGIVLEEPSLIAVQQDRYSQQENIIAVGLEAKKMVGRTPEKTRVARPIRDGVISDFTLAEAMLKHFMVKSIGARYLRLPRILITVPCGANQVERRAIRDIASSVGARSVYLIDEPIAAAVGTNLPIDRATGSMVLDIGGGTADVAVMSMNGIVYANSIRIGSEKFDKAIINYIKNKRNIIIGDVTAEDIKLTIGDMSGVKLSHFEGKGVSIRDGIPESFKISNDEVKEAIIPEINKIVQAIKDALEQTPPELAADISNNGLVLTGGGSQLRGLAQYVASATNLTVILAQHPTTCVVRGGGLVLEMSEINRGNFVNLS
ncbi:MAG: rod shape-determining protein [Methylacidiphilales bacterium]|nr:rod shape-determining protein [Candidatus Methylacidiphilales bacterium]